MNKIATGTWEITHEDNTTSLVVCKTQTEARFLQREMLHLKIKEIKALDI